MDTSDDESDASVDSFENFSITNNHTSLYNDETENNVRKVLYLAKQSSNHSTYIFCPLSDSTIVWNQRITIDDLNESEYVSDYSFCKINLQNIADFLWTRLSTYLQGEKIVLYCLIGTGHPMRHISYLYCIVFLS